MGHSYHLQNKEGFRLKVDLELRFIIGCAWIHLYREGTHDDVTLSDLECISLYHLILYEEYARYVILHSPDI